MFNTNYALLRNTAHYAALFRVPLYFLRPSLFRRIVFVHCICFAPISQACIVRLFLTCATRRSAIVVLFLQPSRVHANASTTSSHPPIADRRQLKRYSSNQPEHQLSPHNRNKLPVRHLVIEKHSTELVKGVVERYVTNVATIAPLVPSVRSRRCSAGKTHVHSLQRLGTIRLIKLTLKFGRRYTLHCQSLSLNLDAENCGQKHRSRHSLNSMQYVWDW